MLLRYLRELTPARRILWCYAIWYGVVLVRYFDPRPQLWLTSLGLSAIVGFALLLSTRSASGSAARQDRWGVFRLFLMPFCVSSFAALVKNRGFILIFSPRLEENLAALFCALAFVLLTLVLRRSAKR